MPDGPHNVLAREAHAELTEALGPPPADAVAELRAALAAAELTDSDRLELWRDLCDSGLREGLIVDDDRSEWIPVVIEGVREAFIFQVSAAIGGREGMRVAAAVRNLNIEYVSRDVAALVAADRAIAELWRDAFREALQSSGLRLPPPRHVPPRPIPPDPPSEPRTWRDKLVPMAVLAAIAAALITRAVGVW